jgi:hypothetical protein
MAKGVTSNRTATIAQGAALSNAFTVLGYSQMVIIMPATWTAASIAFQVSNEGSTPAYAPAYTAAGALIEITASADKAFVTNTYGKTMKLWSETSGVAVNQAAERVITILLIE